MSLILVFSPLFGSVSVGLFSVMCGRNGAIFISSFSVLVSFLCSCSLYFFVARGNVLVVDFLPWIEVAFLEIRWCFLFDSLTFVMLFVVTSISFLVHLFSSSYIAHDPHLPRFMCYLSLFTFFMLILVTSDNFVQIFLGWEGVGLCSYLLINFWFTRVQANKAAIKAMLVNRVGDFGLVLGILTLVFFCGSLDYASVVNCVPFIPSICFYGYCFNSTDLVAGFLFVGAVGKSAQLGLHSWLPDAIEGPTPVSALIHAATIVTAGVFLLVRCSAIFERAPTVLFFISCFGACTAFFAATTGLVQNDLKKVIAYSTCSQLGYMIFSCGFSAYSVGVFHLCNHAFFKALLFLCAGSVIHGLGDEQDLRKIGGLVRLMPLTYSAIVTGSLALLGFPFLSGFYSKDLILEAAGSTFSSVGLFSYILGVFTAFLTAFYSVRLLYLVFIIPVQGFFKVFENVHEASFSILIPLVLLSFGSIFSGFVFKDLFVGPGSSFFGGSIFNSPFLLTFFHGEFSAPFYKLTPMLFAFSGCFFALLCFIYNRLFLYQCKRSSLGQSFFTFFNRKWFFDRTFHALFSQPLFFTGMSFTYKQIDRGFFELLGPFGLSFFVFRVGRFTSTFQSGEVYHYLLVFLFIVCIFSGLFIF